MIPKFRAWKKTNTPEMFRDIAGIDFNRNKIFINYKVSNLHTRLDVEPLDNVILMQSTGLLDKNGKEIFESDIVEWEHKDTGQLVRGIVKYDTELGFWGMTDARFNDLTAIGYLANQRVTVLGNIFENKELVEELK